MRLKKWLLMGLAVLIFALPGCAWQRDLLDHSLYVVQQRGTLRVGLADLGNPFAYDEDGETAGYAAEVAEMIGRGMGLSIEWTITDKDTLAEKLANYEIDIAVADAVADAAQDRQYHLVGPYFHDPYVYVYPAVREDTDFASTARIESDPGTEGDVICPTWADALLTVDDQEAEAALMPLSAAVSLLIGREGYKTVRAEGEYAAYMMVMRKDDHRLNAAVDAVMDTIMTTSALTDLQDKWYGLSTD